MGVNIWDCHLRIIYIGHATTANEKNENRLLWKLDKKTVSMAISCRAHRQVNPEVGNSHHESEELSLIARRLHERSEWRRDVISGLLLRLVHKFLFFRLELRTRLLGQPELHVAWSQGQ